MYNVVTVAYFIFQQFTIIIFESRSALPYIMEYGSTPYVGMALEKNGLPIQCVQNDMLRTLLYV